MWIIMVWQCISPEMNVKIFKKCYLSSTVDETDDGVLWKGSERDGNMSEWVWGRCEDGDSDTDW